ncbi:hypothetical protein HPHPH3_1108 [Helicobacter pylori Hp H-3]|nr:hypothetical protein HPHPH3_1108 [Helicobacter pylori Hp H-3]
MCKRMGIFLKNEFIRGYYIIFEWICHADIFTKLKVSEFLI